LQAVTNNVSFTNQNGGRVDLGDEIYINNATGKTGIGISNPTERLHVNGNTLINGTTQINGATIIYNNLSAYKTTVGQLQVAGGITTAGYSATLAAGPKAEAVGFGSVAIGYDLFVNSDNSIAIGSNGQLGDDGCIALLDGQQGPGAHLSGNSTRDRMYMRFDNGYRLWTEKDFSTGVLMNNGANSWSSVSDSTKKENFIYADGNAFLKKIAAMRLGSWNYKTQNKKIFRHYGAMAQEFDSNFGKDAIGKIGNDTTIATADMDGVMMIALQALIKENEVLKNSCEKQSAEINKLKENEKTLLQRVEKIEAMLFKNGTITAN
jgi:hypothetical protein